MLQKLFDWFDDAANRVLRIAYLIPFVIATALYFGATLPGFLGGFISGVLPWVLAFAVETQTYTSVRKLAVIWNGLKAPALEDFQRQQMKIEAWVQVGIVIALSSFSVWNQASYLAETWEPTTSAFGAPLWLDIAIRALGPAVFFFLTAFGAPLAKTVGEKLLKESHDTLEAFLDVVKNQRKRAVKKIDTEIVDMGSAIRTVASAAKENRVGDVLAEVQGAIVGLARGESGPGSPQSAPSTAPRSGHSTKSYEEACRVAWREGMTAAELASKVGCSVKTADRYVKKFQESFAVTPRISALK